MGPTRNGTKDKDTKDDETNKIKVQSDDTQHQALDSATVDPAHSGTKHKSFISNNDERPQGILRSDDSHHVASKDKRQSVARFDEMNILATLHPPDKDYGFMTIDEPKTPYNYSSGHEPGTSITGIELDELTKKLLEGTRPKSLESPQNTSEDEEWAPNERAKKKAFKERRRKHYNEYLATQVTKQLLEEDDSDDETSSSSATTGSRSSKSSSRSSKGSKVSDSPRNSDNNSKSSKNSDSPKVSKTSKHIEKP